MDKINNAFEKSYNMSSNVIYFPIRHHSPACSYHVKKAIELYKPEIILIEGLEELNELIDVISHDDTSTPFATYHSYVDKKDRRYKIYSPFMDSSPELVAIREGKKLGIKSSFIDMPMPYHLINHREDFDYNIYEKEINFQNAYIDSLLEKEKCDSSEELWEKLFELDFLNKSHEDFVKSVLAYCILQRECKSDKTEKENLIRECYMAEKIREYKKDYKKILVITGGFHTISLLSMKEKFIKPFEIEKDKLNVYPLSYSFDRLDRISGYASGMFFPTYYNKLYNDCEKEGSYQDIANEFFVKTIRELRKQGSSISTADGIEALYMAEELRKLRNKRNIGVWEIREAVLSTFIKGELNPSTNKPLEILDKQLTGNKIGKIPESSMVPPVIMDFRKKAEKLGLSLKKLSKKKITLDIYRKLSHKKRSNFLHTLDFLNVPFGSLIRSANLLNTSTRGNISESWEIAWSVETETKLLDLSVYGSTLKEVIENILYEELDNSDKVKDICQLLSTSYYCGLDKMNKKIFDKIKEVIQKDSSFLSQGHGSSILHFLYQVADLLGIEDKSELYIYIKETYDKSLYLLSIVDDVQDDVQEDFGIALNKLHNLTLDQKLEFDKEKFIEILNISLELKNSYLNGVTASHLYTLGNKTIEDIVNIFKGYVHSSATNKSEVADYLLGLFTYGREVIFINNNFIIELDKMISLLDKKQFMTLLPKLRRSFTYFTPLETNRIGKKIASITDIDSNSLFLEQGIKEESLILGIRLNKLGKERVEELFN